MAVEALEIPVAAVAVLLPLGARAWRVRGWYLRAIVPRCYAATPARVVSKRFLSF